MSLDMQRNEKANMEQLAAAEQQRLEALNRYDVLDTQPEAAFDRITRLVQITLQTPIALVSLVDGYRQWFKSRQGLDVCETPRDISFCVHAIKAKEPFIVCNALEDDRFRNNPLVTGAPKIRFYIGVPLRTPNGHNIGTLCAIDTVPRQPSDTHIAIMQDLARLVVDELELRKLATVDSLTGALTRRGFERLAFMEVARSKRNDRPFGCIVFDIDHFKSVNDRYGHAAGDRVLQTVIETCQRELRSADFVGRLGGEEFGIILPETGLDGSSLVAEKVRRRIAETNIECGSAQIKVTASFGVATFSDSDTVASLIARADGALYSAKNGGRNRVDRAGPEEFSSSIPAKVA